MSKLSDFYTEHKEALKENGIVVNGLYEYREVGEIFCRYGRLMRFDTFQGRDICFLDKRGVFLDQINHFARIERDTLTQGFFDD